MRRGKLEYPEKTSWSRVNDNQQTQPKCGNGFLQELNSRPQCWSASALSTTPTLLPKYVFLNERNALCEERVVDEVKMAMCTGIAEVMDSNPVEVT